MTQMVDALLNGKYKIKLPKHRAEMAEYNSEAGWEKKRLESMHSMIGKGDVVYYVGTELGEMAALCALWGAEVVLFEPNHTAWPSIYQTFKANKLPNPVGNFVLIVQGHAVAVVNGVLFGNGDEKWNGLYRSVWFGFECK